MFIFILTRAKWDIYNLGLKAVCAHQKQSQTSLWKVSDINNRYFGWHSACVCVSSETDLWRKCYVTPWPLTSAPFPELGLELGNRCDPEVKEQTHTHAHRMRSQLQESSSVANSRCQAYHYSLEIGFSFTVTCMLFTNLWLKPITSSYNKSWCVILLCVMPSKYCHSIQ